MKYQWKDSYFVEVPVNRGLAHAVVEVVVDYLLSTTSQWGGSILGH